MRHHRQHPRRVVPTHRTAQWYRLHRRARRVPIERLRHPIGERGAISTVTPLGQVSAVRTDDPVTTNIAFGGADMRDAFITLSMKGMLVQMRWDEPGLRLVYNG